MKLHRNKTDKTQKEVYVEDTYCDITYGGKMEAESESAKPYKIIGDMATFGSYPQSRVTDKKLIRQLDALIGEKPSEKNFGKWTGYGYLCITIPNSHGVGSPMKGEHMWYIDVTFQGEKYRGIYFTLYRAIEISDVSTYTSQIHHDYNVDTLYWFKWEPIKWRILEKKSGSVLLMSDVILDSQNYHHDLLEARRAKGKCIYSNNYKESDVRFWLNSRFYNWAFNNAEKAVIMTIQLDNSASTTGYKHNKYACKDSYDKVFLLSYKDVNNENYGFNSNGNMHDGKRCLKPTNYALSQGTYINNSDGDFIGNGEWWLRSPDKIFNNHALYVDKKGSDSIGMFVTFTTGGIVPALWIKL